MLSVLLVFGHLQPVPPSPVAARKISFNGLKETVVLPQQAGKSSTSGKFYLHLVVSPGAGGGGGGTSNFK